MEHNVPANKRVSHERTGASLSDLLLSMSPTQWVLLVLLVLSILVVGALWAYQTNSTMLIAIPRDGGTHSEAAVGTPRFINPLLANTAADQDLSAVVYAGLLIRDTNNVLVPELAEGYTLSEDGTVYTFTLRPNIVFHDNTPLTSKDVAFTIHTILDTSIRSPLFADWEGVVVDAPNDHTVTFTLPEPYAPFIENTTVGILPEHIWNGLKDDQFAFSQYNVEPVGAGPYRVTSVVRDRTGIPERYDLEAFEQYVLGTPHISHLSFKVYANTADALTAFQEGAVLAVHGIPPGLIAEQLLDGSMDYPVSVYRASQLRIFAVFFNHNRKAIFMRNEVRDALNEATPRNAIVGEILHGYGTPLTTPVPPYLIPEQTEEVETESTNNEEDASEEGDEDDEEAVPVPGQNSVERARAILEDYGWERNEEDGVYERVRDDETLRLSFTLSTVDTPELVKASERIAERWREVGADIELKVYDSADLMRSVILPRRHEALLFGMEVGHELDLYAFWHSSQRNDSGLNIGQFADIEADAALDKLRTEQDPTVRTELLQEFMNRVEEERAAIFVYSPDLTYMVRDDLHNVSLHPLAHASERFDTIHEWHIETDRVWPVVKEWLE